MVLCQPVLGGKVSGRPIDPVNGMWKTVGSVMVVSNLNLCAVDGKYEKPCIFFLPWNMKICIFLTEHFCSFENVKNYPSFRVLRIEIYLIIWSNLQNRTVVAPFLYALTGRCTKSLKSLLKKSAWNMHVRCAKHFSPFSTNRELTRVSCAGWLYRNQLE